jgi:hypothetical protein
MIGCFIIGIDQKSGYIVVRELLDFLTGSFLFPKGMIFRLSGEGRTNVPNN